MNTINKVQKVHLILLSVQLLIIFMVIFLRKSYEFNWGVEDGFYMYLVPILTIVFILIGNMLFANRMKGLDKTSDEATKEHIYSIGAMNRMMMAELALAVGLVGYYLSGNILYIAYSVLLLVFFIALRPTVPKMKEALKRIGL